VAQPTGGGSRADRRAQRTHRGEHPFAALLRAAGPVGQRASSGGHRNYTEREVDRVNYLQGLYAAGLNSRIILEVLPCLETPSDETSDATFARLVEVRDKLRGDIDGLSRTLRSLDELIVFNRKRRGEG
jgi:DNA-binding transcriptional MerR regulator